MQVSIKWLKDYVDIDETAEEIADRLTMAGVPVERVVRADEGLDKVVTGRIERVVPHPDSDHLRICELNIGKEELLQIVTGAQNVQEGDVVPAAMVGALLPDGKKISKGKLRGVPSNGMMCSAGELAIDTEGLPEEQVSGIYILPADTPAGIPAAQALGLDDVVLEFELTANRADCFSVIGIAREIAALTGKPLRVPNIEVSESAPEHAEDLVTVKIEAKELCRRFSARVLRDVKVAPSPAWMVERLQGAGIRAINNVVDVTNFVMLELGQPLHAYDYDAVAGHTLTARRAREGELLHTLDDSSRVAAGDELVIADSEKPAGLAGIMGGLESEITENTTSVILEAASFHSATIRRTARRIGLHSESSGRFERGVDETGTVRAVTRAAQLLAEMGACAVTRGVVDVYPVPKEKTVFEFGARAVGERIGANIPGDWMASALRSLGFTVEERELETYRVTVPSWRGDVTLMEDISEEVARLYGYDNIASRLPSGTVRQGRQSEMQDFADTMRDALAALGMTEELSFSFTSEKALDHLCVPSESPLRRAIPILNPLTDEYPLIRTTLLTSILENAARNIARKNMDLRLFDIAPVFSPKALPVTEPADERLMVAGLMTGRRSPVAWDTDNENVDFYDLKGVVERFFAAIGVRKYTVEEGAHFAMHPGKTAFFKKGREVIAVLGEIHPTVAENFGISQSVYVFEMDAATLMRYRKKKSAIEPLPKYPASTRDLAVLVGADLTTAEIERVIAKKGGKFFRGATLFDVYTGKQVERGKKSMAFHLHFQSDEKTLTDEEVDAAFANILQAAEQELHAQLRG
ncbi:phenylalanine--tRNA ligase subunit beta [Selenomonas sp. F0473]|uniref:phenylalanine--tRNA ligase subunit beta n=1 Tax=Selenomonas sp. F0473 TaxID=999423 RepID=UPI00029DEA62|nr:phenylalanine--tRNA ligase subunit beta [Selenomonas sp. F0473]EKU71475.1 phenylalanine-tRNA ligase, beta subunit [Selenomonas sp. F0473]